jgi:hypothetical protein
MAYVTNRRGFIRTGFRPTYSDPYDATLLGAGKTNGKGLHGLGDIIPNQSVVTWVGQVSGTAMKSVQDVVSAASAALQSDGLSVISTAGLPFSIFDTDIQLTSAPTVTLTLQVNNGMGYGQPSDIASVVNGEIFKASGFMPSGAITVVQPPGGSATQTAAGAGMPCPSGQSLNAAGQCVPGMDWGAWLQQNAIWLGLGVVGLVLLPDLF